MALSYASYLRLDELLALQEPASEGHEHDEMLFIVVHQISELWFKEILHELNLLQLAMENSHAPIVARTLKRVLTIVETLIAQVDVLETLSPMSFASLRERLETAVGCQSSQFREIEFVLGLRRQALIEGYSSGSRERTRLERIMGRHSVYDSFLRYVALLGYPIPDDVLNRDLASEHQPSPAVQESLIEIYRHDPGAWQICELMVDLDAKLQEWRYRHLVMVDRTIGALDSGTCPREIVIRPAFVDLWAIRRAL